MGLFSSIESPVPARVTGNLAYVTLRSGRTVPLVDVTFDTSTGKFIYYGTDVTDRLSQFQKGTFASYDPSADNLAAYNERNAELGRAPNAGGSDSTWGNFVSNVSNAIDFNNPASVTNMLKWLAGLVLVGLIVYFGYKAIVASGFKVKRA